MGKTSHGSTCAFPQSTASVRLPRRQKAILDYVLAHAHNDERPYLSVSVLDVEFLGLLDSGASSTIIGGPGWDILKKLKLKINSDNVASCRVANGQSCPSIGSVDLPIKLENRVRMISALVVPDLPHTLILGVDFWRKFGIVPDLHGGNWVFRRDADVSVGAIASEEHLTPDQTRILNEVVQEAFRDMGDELGCTNLVEHEIKTSCRPIKQRYYPVSPVMQGHIDAELDKLLEQGIVEPSTSPWSSPILLVKKKDGSYRFCVDYRKLNAVTEKDAYPLPYINATLDRLRNAKFLSSMDIKSAYFQVPLEESSRPLTAFTVPNRGLFHFLRLPMGLSNSPATFQRLVDRVLGPDLEPYVFVYLDDIIIITDTFEKHVEVLKEVFKRLKAANLTVSKKKCHFCRPELLYLGYVVDSTGLRMDPAKVQAILNIPVPTSVSEVRRLLGLASWYRRFVPNFADLIAPLTELLKKGRPFKWSVQCDEALNNLKERLIGAPVLSCPDFSKPFTIQCDASGYGIGAVLTQQQEDGEKVICYLSRSLTRLERNYTTTERECLAVLWAIEKLRPYIEGTHFTVITDHASLLWLDRLESPSGRLARWAIRLQQYDYTIIHRKGKYNIVPDVLSRSVPVLDTVDTTLGCSSDPWYGKLLDGIVKTPHRFPSWQLIQGKLFKNVTPRIPELASPSDYWREVVPRPHRKALIGKVHESLLHVGVYKTYHKLAERYYWPKMRSDVASFIRRCITCHAIKPEQRKPPGFMLSKQVSIHRPFELMSADLVGPLPRTRSGNQYIFVIADCFSKFPLLFPLRFATASAIVKILDTHVFPIFGCPNSIILDNGVQFRSKEVTNFLKSYNVNIQYTALYHPQANPVERINRVIKTMLRSYLSEDQRGWDRQLSQVGLAIRSSKHEVTGHSPNMIVFGREISLKGENACPDRIQFDRSALTKEREQAFARLYADVQRKLSRAYETNSRTYNLRRRDVQYTVNQLVWRRNQVLSDAAKYFSAKLAPKYVGPFLVSKRVSPWTYELQGEDGKYQGVWHAKDLKSHPPDQQATGHLSD